MRNLIRFTALLLAFTLSLPAVFAQYDDDIYYSPSEAKKAQEAAMKADMWSTDANDDWDIDGYNRRYTPASTGASSATSGSLTSLNKGDRDTVYIIKENYHYSYADLLFRFHSGFYRPSWYWHTAWGWGDPFYWDRWYNDPFYWDSYYAWGWSWGWGGVHVGWHTPIYHRPYYGWRPAPHHHHHHYVPVHRAPAHRIGSGSHGYINHRGYHSPVVARGGDRHSGLRGGSGSRGGSVMRGSNGSRGGGTREGIRNGGSSRHQGASSRGESSGSRHQGASSRHQGSSSRGESGRGSYDGSRHSGGSRGGGGFGGGGSRGGGGFGGGHSGGGHSGGGGRGHR